MKQEEFDKYINEFKKLPLKRKKIEVINELKKFLAITIKLKQDLKIEKEILMNREVLDIKESMQEEDFIEAVYVYLYSIEESLGDYLDTITNLIYEEDNNEN